MSSVSLDGDEPFDEISNSRMLRGHQYFFKTLIVYALNFFCGSACCTGAERNPRTMRRAVVSRAVGRRAHPFYISAYSEASQGAPQFPSRSTHISRALGGMTLRVRTYSSHLRKDCRSESPGVQLREM